MPHVKYLPLLTLILAISTIVTTYIISVTNGKYEWWLPMISETGNYPPASSYVSGARKWECRFVLFAISVIILSLLPLKALITRVLSRIFSWGLTATAVVSTIMIYIRYLQIRQIFSTKRFQMHEHHRYFVRLNIVQMVFAAIAALGLSLLANFQDVNVKQVHVPASLVFFFCAVVHLSIMTRLCRFINGKRHLALHVARIVLPVASSIALVLGILFKFFARDPAYQSINFDAYAALNEWLCVLTLGFYWLLFYFDLRHIHNFKFLVHTYAFEDEEHTGMYIPVVGESLNYSSSDQLSPRNRGYDD